MKNPNFRPERITSDPELEALLHPAGAFDQPRDVVNDPELTLNEKRAILASWASDACAVEAAPALRRAPGGQRPVSIDEILDALRDLDKETRARALDPSRYRRQLRRQSIEAFRTKSETLTRVRRPEQGGRRELH
jgi:hypothetical protein